MGEVIFQKLKKLLPGLKKNILLKRYTTFRIGGKAQYFFIAKNKSDIKMAVFVAKKANVPFFILAGGSNVLISDKGFKGLVIKIRNEKLKMEEHNSKLKIFAEAGILLKELVKNSQKLGFSGLEWASGIPGTLGGAIRGNAGAFGGEIKDVVSEVEFLDKRGNIKKISNKQCRFFYRSSIFKMNNWIVLSAIIKLKKGNKEHIKSVVKKYINFRKKKHPLEYPSAGSIFKNYDFKKISAKIKASFKNVVKKDPFPVIPSSYLISEAGLKGLRVGKAEISKKHPNYIVNLGGASAKDVVELIKEAKKKIKIKFGIILEEEITYLGF